MWTVKKEAYDADILVRLRNWRGLHLSRSGELFEAAADEIERLRLADEERAALEFAIRRLDRTLRGNEECDHHDVLRGLLDRMM